MIDKRQSDFNRKLGIARDGKLPMHVRAFAVAELVCQPVSLLLVAAVVVLAVLRYADIWTPPLMVSRWMVPILVAAAVGYLTNWVAITILFEPQMDSECSGIMKSDCCHNQISPSWP